MNAQPHPENDFHESSPQSSQPRDQADPAGPAASNGEPAAHDGGEPPTHDDSAHQASAQPGAAADEAFADSDSAVPESRDEALERMAHEVEQARQRVLIAQAELENFRKRTRKDYEEQLRFAALPLVEDLLQVRDNLIRAIDAAAASGGSGSSDGLKAGVELVAKQLDDVFAKHGINAIPAVGEPFDPNVHQAISQMPSPEHPEGVVAIEATTGFQMHQRVVRPSQVVVSTGTPQS